MNIIISIVFILLPDSLILILEKIFAMLIHNKFYGKLGCNDELIARSCSKGYKLCPTIKYVSKSINYVPFHVV